jgi:hypothetical protein
MARDRNRHGSTGIALAAALLALTGMAGLASAAGNVHDGLADPDHAVGKGEEVDHTFSYKVDDVTNEGEEVRLFVTFPDEIDSERLDSWGGEVTDRETQATVSISSSASIVDGPDGDGIQETVTVGVQPEGERASRDLLVNFTGSIAWPTVDEQRQMPVQASVEDPDGPDVTLVEFAIVTLEPEGSTTDTESVDVATGQAREIDASSATLEGELVTLDGADSADVWFTYWIEGQRSDTLATTDRQTLSSTGPYTAHLADLQDGTRYVFEAHAETGDDEAAGARATFATDASAGETAIADGTIDPASVEAGQQAQHAFTYTVEDVSNDGTSVELYLVLPDAVAGDRLSSFGAEVVDRDTGEAVAIASSAETVDGPDEDGVQETVAIGVQPEGERETVDLVVTLEGEVDWPDVDHEPELPVEAAVIDHSGTDVDPPVAFGSVLIEATAAQPTDGTTSGSSDEPSGQAASNDAPVGAVTALAAASVAASVLRRSG